MGRESHNRATARWRAKNPNYKKDWYARNAEHARAYSREFYVGRESVYKFNAKRWRKRNHKHALELQRKNYWKNPLKKCKQNRRWIASVKKRVIALYGGKCQWRGCNWVDPRGLQIDHKFGVKGEERNSRTRSGTGLYLAILKGKKNKKDFQLLCAGHNMVKRILHKEHTNRMRK